MSPPSGRAGGVDDGAVLVNRWVCGLGMTQAETADWRRRVVPSRVVNQELARDDG
jgi:hypothetical protein